MIRSRALLLRKFQQGAMLPRQFQQGCKVGGFYVSEKTMLVVNIYAVMRDPVLWENLEDFKPERFLVSSRLQGQEEDKIKEEVLKYIPFGGGRRGCLGSNLAYLFLETVIGVMVQCFDWRIKEDRVNMDEAGGAVSLTMAHPLNCTPVARTLNPLTSTS